LIEKYAWADKSAQVVLLNNFWPVTGVFERLYCQTPALKVKTILIDMRACLIYGQQCKF